MIAAIVYALCGLAALGCAVMLLVGYRRTRFRLLLWSGVCFAALAGANLLLVPDRILFPDYELKIFRDLLTASGLLILLGALIWEGR